MAKGRTVVEELKGAGKGLLEQVKEAIHQGNVRKVIIKNEAGKVIAHFPLYAGIAGVLLAPILSAIAVVVGGVNNCTITIHKQE